MYPFFRFRPTETSVFLKMEYVWHSASVKFDSYELLTELCHLQHTILLLAYLRLK